MLQSQRTVSVDTSKAAPALALGGAAGQADSSMELAGLARLQIAAAVTCRVTKYGPTPGGFYWLQNDPAHIHTAKNPVEYLFKKKSENIIREVQHKNGQQPPVRTRSTLWTSRGLQVHLQSDVVRSMDGVNDLKGLFQPILPFHG